MKLALSLILLLVLLVLASAWMHFQTSYGINLKSDSRVLDPNPLLIDKHGRLQNNVSLANSLTSTCYGTVADGISKLIIVIDSNNTLQLSISNTEPADRSSGTLSNLSSQSNPTVARYKLTSSTVVSPQPDNGKKLVVAVYTPPDFILLPKGVNHKSLYISANETNIPRVKIDLYHTPVVLVHGVWTNSSHSWESAGFYTTLTKNGYDVSFADYGAYSATTYDPYANNSNGNYGIKAINDKIGSILRDYHNHKLIAAAQVDIVAHSMGGLMARGFLQQGHYKNISNYMDGYINHLVTIGTPHFGAHLAGLLYNYRNTEYCYGLATATIIFKNFFCESDKVNYQVLKLKDIFSDKYHTPIDKGAIEALTPGSDAYSHFCPTDVKSYAIAGSWRSLATRSHVVLEWLYKNVLGNPNFDLDKDGFHDNNDLQVSVASQLGGIGLPTPTKEGSGNTITNKSAIYFNTLHSVRFINPFDSDVYAELTSPKIQSDLVTLLESPDTTFAHTIGVGSPCSIPKILSK